MKDITLNISSKDVRSIKIKGFSSWYDLNNRQEEHLVIDKNHVSFSIDTHLKTKSNTELVFETEIGENKFDKLVESILFHYANKTKTCICDGYMYTVELLLNNGLVIEKSNFLTFMANDLTRFELEIEKLIPYGVITPTFLSGATDMLKMVKDGIKTIKGLTEVLDDFSNNKMFLRSILDACGYVDNSLELFNQVKTDNKDDVISLLSNKNVDEVGNFLYSMLLTISKYDPMCGIARYIPIIHYCIDRIIESIVIERKQVNNI